MLNSENKMARVKCWLSLAMLLPVLGCMIEAVFMWVPDLKLDNWYDQTNLSKTALMTAVIMTALEALPATFFYYTCHHIENGWRMPATVCAALMLAAYIGGVVLWNGYNPLSLTFYDIMMIALRFLAGVLTVLYAVRWSQRQNMALSWLALTLFIARTGMQTEAFLREASQTTDRVLLTQCLVHGFAYAIMNLFIGLAYYTGFHPSERPEAV